MRLRLYLVFGIVTISMVGYGNFTGRIYQDTLTGESSFTPDGKDGPRRVGPGGIYFFPHK